MESESSLLSTILFYGFYSVSLLLETFLFYLIVKKTPDYIKEIKIFLLASNISNLSLIFISAGSRFRIIPSETTLAVLCEGFSVKYLGPHVCFHGFSALLTIACVICLVNVDILYYRKLVLLSNTNALSLAKRLCVCCSSFVVIPILFCVIPHDFAIVLDDILTTHPEYHLEQYEHIGGFSVIHHFLNYTLLSICMAIEVGGPSVMVYLGRQCQKHLKKYNKHLSNATRSNFKNLIRLVYLQAAVQMFSNVLLFFLFFFNNFLAGSLVFPQYILPLLLTTSTILDPIAIIFYTKSFRSVIMKLLGINRDPAVTMINTVDPRAQQGNMFNQRRNLPEQRRF